MKFTSNPTLLIDHPRKKCLNCCTLMQSIQLQHARSAFYKRPSRLCRVTHCGEAAAAAGSVTSSSTAGKSSLLSLSMSSSNAVNQYIHITQQYYNLHNGCSVVHKTHKKTLIKAFRIYDLKGDY